MNLRFRGLLNGVSAGIRNALSQRSLEPSGRVTRGAPWRRLPILLIVFFCAACHGFFVFDSFSFGTDHLRKAEELSRQRKFDEAILEYQRHISYRLSLAQRPEWENPYFYLLIIGDLLLENGKPDEAIRSYLDADEKKVHSGLVSDRLRGVASWYTEHGNYSAAIDVLRTHRDKDPLLFDAMLDRISKELTAKEEAEKNHLAP